jgi:hypothetical protein
MRNNLTFLNEPSIVQRRLLPAAMTKHETLRTGTQNVTEHIVRATERDLRQEEAKNIVPNFVPTLCIEALLLAAIAEPVF